MASWIISAFLIDNLFGHSRQTIEGFWLLLRHNQSRFSLTFQIKRIQTPPVSVVWHYVMNYGPKCPNREYTNQKVFDP